MARCASNLKQIHVALILYAQQNNDSFPVGLNFGQAYFSTASRMPFKNAMDDFISNSNVFYCPADKLKAAEWANGKFSYFYMHVGGSYSSSNLNPPYTLSPSPFTNGVGSQIILMSDPFVDPRSPGGGTPIEMPRNTNHLNGFNTLFVPGNVKFQVNDVSLRKNLYNE